MTQQINELPVTQTMPFVPAQLCCGTGCTCSAPSEELEIVGGVSEQARRDFERIAREMIAWLNEHMHPHTTVLISPTHAELLVGEIGFETFDYVRD